MIKQYGLYRDYSEGNLAEAMFYLASQLEEQFPRRSATWIHKAPEANGVGSIAWKLLSDTSPLTNEGRKI